MSEISQKLFCFGYGYTCEYLGHELSQRAGSLWSLAGTTRDPERRAALRARGVQVFPFESETPLSDPANALKDTTHIIVSTPPDENGDPVFHTHADDLRKIKTLKWVGYLSTTGVYGDRQGGWVDENSELRPTSRRGSRRVQAEEEWLSLYQSYGIPVHIFRLAGIYGPGRSALDSVRAGVARRINKPGHAFARIHVEDIVGTLLASMDKPSPGKVYNVCDDEPAPSHEVIAYACELLGQPAPPMVDFDDANLAPMTRSFYMDNRRVHNDRIKSELGVKLRYPDFRAGLRGCLAAEQHAIKSFSHGGAAAAGHNT